MNLNNLSIYPTIKILLNTGNKSLEESMALSALLKYKVKTYAELKTFIECGYPEFNTAYFYDLLKKGEAYIEKCSKKVTNAPLYTFDTYQKSGLDVSALEKVDEVVKSNVLPYNSPLTRDDGLIVRLRGLTIADLKSLLSLYGTNTKNALEMTTASFGHAKSEQVARLIKFYEDQVVRTASSYASLNNSENLFYDGLSYKRHLVATNCVDILDTLKESTEFIWGTTTPEQMQDLTRKVTYPNSRKDDAARNKFINDIAYYTTMDELNDDVARKRATQRFIIR